MTGLAMSVSVKIKRGAKRVNLTTIRFTQQRHVLGNYSNNRNIKLIILIASNKHCHPFSQAAIISIFEA